MEYELKQKLKKAGKNLARNIFQYILILFLLTLLIREFYPDYVNHYININYFMVIVVFFGAITVLTTEEKPVKKQPVRKKDYVLVVFMGILGAIIIYLRLRELGWISYLISILGGFLIIFLSILFLKEDQ